MPPKSPPFKLVYRAFNKVEYHIAKSEDVFERRGFDLAYMARMFPGYVLERRDNRDYGEVRYQAIGELFGEIYIVVYAARGSICRLITAWLADQYERALWHDYGR